MGRESSPGSIPRTIAQQRQSRYAKSRPHHPFISSRRIVVLPSFPVSLGHWEKITRFCYSTVLGYFSVFPRFVDSSEGLRLEQSLHALIPTHLLWFALPGELGISILLDVKSVDENEEKIPYFLNLGTLMTLMTLIA
jgi:hypothetical protein